MSTLEQQLILSQLPYPKYYNGYQWNTIIANTRKHIPKYLHDDLPKLKFEPVRQQFKQLNQIQCPRLTYFNTRIEQNKHRGQKRAERSLSRPNYSDKLQDELKDIRSQLQYALLTSDRNSNVIKKLIARAAAIEQELILINGKKYKKVQKKRSHSMAVMNKPQKCFENTLDIVITARKNILNSSKVEEEVKIDGVNIKAVLLPYIQ